jgi:NADH-quinone oxidoreductase E subunit
VSEPAREDAPAIPSAEDSPLAMRTERSHEDSGRLFLNMGPSHPSTHGVLRIVLEMDGEAVVRADPDIGYLHRGMEKIAETYGFTKFIPYTDRMDYLAPVANNIAVCGAVERLMGLDLPPRGNAIRVVCAELSRISAHLLGLGAFAMDIGAMTVFLYCFREREAVYGFMESLTGARFTVSYPRVGGLSRDLPEGWAEAVLGFAREMPARIERDVEKLLSRNGIWVGRLDGVGVIPREVAISYGLTGPNLRGSGVEWDLRKEFPYFGYEQYGGRLRPLPLPRGGDQAVGPDHPPGAGEAPRRPHRGGGRQALPAAQGEGAHPDGGADPPVHDRDRGAPRAGGGDLLGPREPQGRARLLYRRGRDLAPLSSADARPVLREPLDPALAAAGLHAQRHGGRARVPRLRHGGMRPVSAAPFPQPLAAELDRIVARYPQRAAAMLPVLTRLQAERGFLSEQTVAEVAAYLQVPEAHVHGVVSFYSMYDREKVGKHKLYVCRTLSCRLRGAEEVIRGLEKELGVERGGTTADGRVTLVPFECLGLCEMAPCAIAGEKRWGPIDPANLRGLLEELR